MKRWNWLTIALVALLLAAVVLAGCASKQACPLPDDFPDYDMLASWVESNAQPFESGSGWGAWYTAALTVQRQAAADGYLVSAVILEKPDSGGEYLVWCTAIAGGELYWWHPEDSVPVLWFSKK
ncbi:hypothetical protein ACFLTN_04250 [Chloroflexota bacterium]